MTRLPPPVTLRPVAPIKPVEPDYDISSYFYPRDDAQRTRADEERDFARDGGF